MTVDVESVDVMNVPVVLSAAVVEVPINVDVTRGDPVTVNVSPVVLGADLASEAASITLAVGGAQGPPGSPGSGSMVLGEIPGGAVDGLNSVYTTRAPFQAGGTALYLNGLREFHYTETGPNEITFEDAPASTDAIRIDYVV